jgi:hypothetical protein
MIRPILYLTVIAFCAIALFFVDSSSASFAALAGIIAALTIPLLDLAASNWRYARLSWYSARYHNQKVRISVSYLFRIKVDDRYMLIKGRRWDQYQPVGGVYKVSSGARQFLNDVGALDDDLVPVDAVSKNDLRIRIPGRNLIRFMRWFEAGFSRETSPWREFCEELIVTNILRFEDFPYIFHDFVRREVRPIRFSEYAQSMELLIADIHELHPTAEQLAALQKLREVGHQDIAWASEGQIRRFGAVPGQKQEVTIGEPAVWTL